MTIRQPNSLLRSERSAVHNLAISSLLVASFLASSVAASIPETKQLTLIGAAKEALELPPLAAFADEVERWGVVGNTQVERPASIARQPFTLGLSEYRIPTQHRLFARPPPKRIVLPDVETRVAGVDFGVWPQVSENKRFSLGLAVGHSEDPLRDVDSPNLYAFVRNSPFNGVDPLGQCKLTDAKCWAMAALEFGRQTAVDAGRFVKDVAVSTVDMGTAGSVSDFTAQAKTFFGTEGSLSERADAAQAAGRDARFDAVTMGLYGAEDRGEHAFNLSGLGGVKAGAHRMGSAIVEGDVGEFTLGLSEAGGGAGQFALMIAGGARTVQRPASGPPMQRPRTNPNLETGVGYGAADAPVRIEGAWTINDLKQGLLGHPPRKLGSPDIHHGDQFPVGSKHEVLPQVHRNNQALHRSRHNPGVTREMRQQDRQLHWWYRAREHGADGLLPDWIYDKPQAKGGN